MIGTPELIIIALLVMLFFGSAQLPKLAKSMGGFINDFNEAKEGKAAEAKKSTAAKKTATTKKVVKKAAAKKKTTAKKA